MIRFFTQLLIAIIIPVLAGFSFPHRTTEQASNNGNHVYPDHLPNALTGGFGEETCHSCHFDYDINHEGGSLTVEGLEEKYVAGKQYELVVTVESERLEKGGFQMTARFEDGTQAGQFEWTGDRIGFTPSVSDTIQYLQHTAAGTNPTAEKEVRWSFVWEAPRNDSGPVIFNIAANAGNDDLSPFGDWIYVREIKTVGR